MTPTLGRPLRSGDLESVTGLVARSFDDKILPFMIYGQHGIANFLSNSLRHPLAIPRIERVVVDSPETDEVMAYADFRQLDDETGFLSYVCVDEDHRGRRLADRLIEDFLGKHPRFSAMELDVFTDNSSARAMYARSGFAISGRSLWIDREIPTSRAIGGSVEIGGLPSALAVWDRFGFCEFDVSLEGRSSRMGLMGNRLRCMTPEDFLDDSLLRQIKMVLPHIRSAFSIVADGFPVPRSANVVKGSERMVLHLGSGRPGFGGER